MIVRDSANGIEVYMVKRPGKGDFPDLYVFPGGKVDEDDWQPDLCPDLADSDASVRLGLDAGAIRYWVAVARECFEEVGVLLARDANGIHVPDVNQRVLQAQLRGKLLSSEMSWAEVIVSDRIISIKVNSEKAEIGLFKISLVLEGIDPAYDYESEATYDFELLVKEKALSAVENLAWLEEL